MARNKPNARRPKLPMNSALRDVTGTRGEKLTELALTDYSQFDQPLFRPGFLGEKWPFVDFYVELTDISDQRPYFFAQTKTSSTPLSKTARNLRISARKRDIENLLKIPGPTYIIGVHEPTKRVFIRSVHEGILKQAVTTIPLEYELNPTNLKTLHDEVRDYWKASARKPLRSNFT